MKQNKNSKGTIRRLMGYIATQHKSMFTLVIVAVLVSVAAGLAGSMFMQVVIDDYILRMVETGENLYRGLLLVLVAMAVVYAVGALCTWLYSRTMAVISQSVLKTIRDDLFSGMQKLPIRFFDTHTHGDVMSVYTNDTDTLRQLISQSIPMMISSAFSIVLSFCVMIHFNLWLTIVVLIITVIMILVSRKMVKISGKYFAKQQGSIGKVNGYIEEMLNGQKVVKVFCHEKETKQRFEELNEEVFQNAVIAGGTSVVMMPVMAAFGNIQYLVVAVLGGAMALFGGGTFTLTIGALVSFLSLVRQFSSSITQTAQQMNSVVLGFAGAERIFELMDEEPEEDHGYVTLVKTSEKDGALTEDAQGTIWAWKHPHHDGTLTYTKVEGNVVFDHVDFTYDGKKLVLHDISLYAKPGQKIAFVGATGAGKTTITNLINRFYDIADGKIRYDGININKIKKPDLRRSMSIILQDVNLFTGTILDNIRYGSLGATDEECIEAAKLSGADSFIRRMPEGYYTMIRGDGSALSQGQNQLISIARAAVANPPVMIMDEATSSIDTRTESIVQRGMDRLMEGRTVFVIAHRLSTVQNSKAIMVLEAGRIIERGSHEQLIEQKGQYYQLYTGAFELE
ncbi:MAG: ABC transporter ATP-binding protein [Eubacteriales bacterium]|nr:ABC transporter ATP-binding protein [Eubacteriales bacterium]